jgi:hypothetical protein
MSLLLRDEPHPVHVHRLESELEHELLILIILACAVLALLLHGMLEQRLPSSRIQGGEFGLRVVVQLDY